MVNILDLPLELREQIYAHLLTFPSAHPTLQPAILTACRQTHAEALPILYAHNIFQCHPSLLVSFPRLHNPIHRDGPYTFPKSLEYPRISESTSPGLRLVRRWSLRARLDCGPFWDAEKVERAFTGAEELTVEVLQSAFGECGNEVLRIFEGVRGVRRVRIWGSTTGMEGYVRWLEGVMRSLAGSEFEPYMEAGETGSGNGT